MQSRSTGLGERLTTRDAVVDLLRQRILSGELKPGQRLMVPEIAQQLNVSQTPAREALQVLASHGFLVVNAYKGARVAELNAEDCQELYLMREALERLAAREGTLAIQPADLEALSQHLELMAVAASKRDVDSFIDADRAFHHAHYMASGRASLWQRIMDLRSTCERYTRLTYQFGPDEMLAAISGHRALIELVRAGDADAVELWVSRTLVRVPETTRILLAEQPS